MLSDKVKKVKIKTKKIATGNTKNNIKRNKIKRNQKKRNKVETSTYLYVRFFYPDLRRPLCRQLIQLCPSQSLFSLKEIKIVFSINDFNILEGRYPLLKRSDGITINTTTQYNTTQHNTTQ